MFSDIKVLIVEDDRRFAATLRTGMAARGFRTTWTDSVAEAIEYIHTEDPDLLVLDLSLLNGRGEPVLDQWVRDRRAPAVVVSAPVSTSEVDDLYTHGAWNVLPKPLTWETFYLIVERYGMIVRDRRTAIKVGRLQKAVTALAILVAALGGLEIIPRLLEIAGIIL